MLANRSPVLPADHPRYAIAELVEMRRQMLRFSRSVPPGPERNQHLQIAVSLRRLFRDRAWLDAHTVDVLAPLSPTALPCAVDGRP
jgi:hypothetical protein